MYYYWIYGILWDIFIYVYIYYCGIFYVSCCNALISLQG